MSDAQFKDEMESLQFSGHAVKWFVHAKNRFAKREGYFSRAIAESVAAGKGFIVTPDFA